MPPLYARARTGLGALRARHRWLLPTACVAATAVAFSIGHLTGRQVSGTPLSSLNLELAQQRSELSAARRAVEEQVDALASRVGQMHAQLIRLDALGKRLTELADLDRGEFNFDSSPAMGGPIADELPQAGAAAVVPNLTDMLDRLGATLDDRQRQLNALETLILSRELTREIVPGSRPVVGGHISSYFGQRTDPFTGNPAFHAGIDFPGSVGTEILAAATGVVTFAGRDGGYGLSVEITHGDGLVTRYGHNSTLLVRVGQTVRKGDPVARMGSTGRSTAPHLHFEVLRNGAPVNPLYFLRRGS